MNAVVSVASRVQLNDYITIEGLDQEIQERMLRYLLTFHNRTRKRVRVHLLIAFEGESFLNNSR